jgi:hypothetical protein
VVAEAVALDPDEGERLLQAWARARNLLISEVRVALETHRAAVGQRTFAESRVADDEAVHDDRRAARRAAVAAFDAAVEAYGAAVRDWAQSCSAVEPSRVAARPRGASDRPGGRSGRRCLVAG